MSKRPKTKEDLAIIRAAIQKDIASGATIDQAVAKVWAEHPDAANRVIKSKDTPDA